MKCAAVRRLSLSAYFYFSITVGNENAVKSPVSILSSRYKVLMLRFFKEVRQRKFFKLSTQSCIYMYLMKQGLPRGGALSKHKMRLLEKK